MQLMKSALLVAVLVLGCFAATATAEENCPEIDGSLHFELYKTYKEFEIATAETFSGADQQILSEYAQGGCAHLVELNPSEIALLLKKKQKREFRIVLAEAVSGTSKQKWKVQELAVFSDDVPILSKPRGGFYSDIVTRKRVTVTRNSIAVQVSLAESGKRFVYKKIDEGGFVSCQVQ